jgi:hypothetical protein
VACGDIGNQILYCPRVYDRGENGRVRALRGTVPSVPYEYEAMTYVISVTESRKSNDQHQTQQLYSPPVRTVSAAAGHPMNMATFFFEEIDDDDADDADASKKASMKAKMPVTDETGDEKSVRVLKARLMKAAEGMEGKAFDKLMRAMLTHYGIKLPKNSTVKAVVEQLADQLQYWTEDEDEDDDDED